MSSPPPPAATPPASAPDVPPGDPPADDEVIESNLEEAFSRIIDEGEQRLERATSAMLATGAVAGIEVGIGILALLAVEQRTRSTLLGGIAFSVGFLALLLGRSELFTEGFLVPVTTWVARRARLRDLVRLWVTTLAANLFGGWVVTWLIVAGFPDLKDQAIHAATHFIDAGIGVRSMALGILAGAAITLMTRMQHGTDSMPAKIAASVAGAFVLAGLPLFHSILDSLIIFTALHTGHAPFGYLDWLGWVGWAALWNMLGGIVLVTVLRLVRSRQRVAQERHAEE